MNVGLIEQLAANGFSGTAFEQHVVWQHDGSTAVLFEDGEDVLQEVQLLVAGRCPKVVPIDDQRLAQLIARIVDNRHAALLAERRVGQDDVVLAVFRGQGVTPADDRQIAF